MTVHRTTPAAEIAPRSVRRSATAVTAAWITVALVLLPLGWFARHPTSDGERFGATGAAVLVGFCVVMLVTMLGSMLRQQRNERLAIDGEHLTYTDSRGRTVAIPRWDIAHVVCVTAMVPGSKTGPRPERWLIVVRASGPPYTSRASMLDVGDVHGLLTWAGVPVYTPAERPPVRDLPALVPGVRLRFSERRPVAWVLAMIGSALAVGVGLAVIGAVAGWN